MCSTGKEEELAYYQSTDTLLLVYSLLARGFLSGKLHSDDPSTHKVLDKASKRAYFYSDNLAKLHRIEEIASSLGISVPALTIAYLTHKNGVIIPSIGSGSASRIEGNLDAANIDLDEATMRQLDGIAAS